MSESHEKFVGDMVGRIDPAKPASLVFTIADYQIFDPSLPVVTFVYGGEGKQGIVLWNLEPGQENDYHLHPSTEHLHIVLSGTAEYTLAGEAPVVVRPGQAVMVPAAVPHGIRNIGADRCTYMAVTSPGEYTKVLVEREG
jgi:quercetin dioxygenase-like cupin family protein